MVPALTTVHVPIHDFGSVAARLLLEQIESGEASQRRAQAKVRSVPEGEVLLGILPMDVEVFGVLKDRGIAVC